MRLLSFLAFLFAPLAPLTPLSGLEIVIWERVLPQGAFTEGAFVSHVMATEASYTLSLPAGEGDNDSFDLFAGELWCWELELPLGSYSLVVHATSGNLVYKLETTIEVVAGAAQPQVVATDSGLFLLDRNGEIYCSGRNTTGQLGLGDRTGRSNFTLIPSSNFSGQVRQIAASPYHTLFLTEWNEVYTCGWNLNNTLGLGGSLGDFVTTPTLISTFAELYVVQVAASTFGSWFLLNDGSVYAAGTNVNGELGLGHNSDVTLPTLIPSSAYGASLGPLSGHFVISITTLYRACALLCSDGALFVMGENGGGAAGAWRYE